MSGEGSRSRALSRGLLVSVSLAVMAFATTAAAQTGSAPISFSIPAQDLNRATLAFARAAGVRVLYDTGRLSGISSPGVSGTLTSSQALSALLSGTGLSWRQSGVNTVTIFDPSAVAAGGGADGDAIQLDAIDVSGGLGQVRAEDLPYVTPGTTNYVSTEQLERVPGVTAGDMFRGVPGVDIRGNHNGSQIDVAIRGQHGNNRVKVMVEGTQQATSSHQGYNGQDNQTFVDQDLISSISIEKGPVSGPYGAGVTGGVVNMRTLMADDILLPDRDFGVRIRGGLMGNVTENPAPVGQLSFNYDRPAIWDMEGKSGSLAFAAKTDLVEFVAAVTKRQRGNYFAGTKGETSYGPAARDTYTPYQPGAEVYNTSEDSESALIKGIARFGDGHSIELGYLHSESEFGWVYPINLNLPNGHSQQPLNGMESERLWSRYKWNPEGNDLADFQANIWKTNLEKYDHYRTTPALPAIVDGWGAEIWNRSRIDTSLGVVTATYGGEYSFEDANLEGGYMGNQARREVGSAFLDVKWSPWDWLTLNGGARYTAFETFGRFQQTSGAQNVITAEMDGSDVTTSAGIIVQPLESIQLFAQYSEAYRPPSIRESSPQAFAGYDQNPYLRPEQSKNIEVGSNLMLDDVFLDQDRVRAKLAYFQSDFKDYITAVVPSWIPPYGYYYHNIPGAHINGIELSGSYKSDLFFIEANLNYYTKYEYCYPEQVAAIYRGCVQYLLGVQNQSVPPKYSGSVTAGTTLFDDALTLGASARFFSQSVFPQRLPNGTFLVNRTFWRPDTIVDVFGSYKFNEHAELSLSVENVFDRFYLEPMLVSRMPAPGRTARVTFTAKF